MNIRSDVVTQYINCIDHLLNTHYGVSINDTDLSNPQTLKVAADNHIQPFELINEWANEIDAVRTDSTSWIATNEISQNDQLNYMKTHQ